MKALVGGYGSIGKRHINNLSKIKDMQIIVNTKRKNDNFLKKNNCIVFSSLHACVKQKPTFAIICNETSLHVKSALVLAKAGIHMMIEKPLSDKLTNCQKLLEISKKKKLSVMIGSNLRFHPGVQLLRNIIKKEEIGRIISVKTENGSFLPNWHPNENYKKNYAANHNLGGGVVLTCIHEIDYLYWMFGQVNEISSICGQYSELNISSEDLAEFSLYFKNSVVAQVHLDFFQQPNTRSCKLIGTKGTVIWDFEKPFVKKYYFASKKWTNLKISYSKIDQTYVDELNHFLNCIKKNSKSINPLEEGIYTIKLALIIKKSSKLKKSISVGK